MSADATWGFLRRHLPGSAALRRAAVWPSPLCRPLVRRWLRHHAPTPAADPDRAADALSRALRLLSADDRTFCRGVRLDGWRLAVERRDEGFELADEGGEMLWPVALRALLLFAGAHPDSLHPPSRREIPAGGGPRLIVRTRAAADGSFHVVVAASAG